jgi:hypothetical protein
VWGVCVGGGVGVLGVFVGCCGCVLWVGGCVCV